MTKNLLTLTTYTLPRTFYGINIPIAIQSAYLRDYASRNNLVFSLPKTEICFKNSYDILIEILTDKQNHNLNIGMASILILPHQDTNLLDFLTSTRREIDITWHFPLENLQISSEKVRGWSNDFTSLKRLAS
jgi:sporadic carbohydrate cluster protein (TIGR04323 family)